jgi:hypothetical protein
MTKLFPEATSAAEEETTDGFAEAVLLVLGRVKEALEKKPADRDSYIDALLALTDLIRRLAGDRAAQRMLHLVYALSDLNNGIVSKLLEPSERTGAKPSVLWAQQAYAALALECLVRTGAGLDEAARHVALGRRFATDTVINWRKEFRADRVSNKVGQAMFTNGLSRIDQFDANQLRGLAEGFISVVKSIEQEQDF